ncbi:MAG: endonuclease/exonuclease/phosphatase family protein, partial [Pseudomonadota bacterium]
VNTLRGADADVILLQEINGSTRLVVEQLRAAYPFTVDCSLGGARHAPGILSRLPITDGSAACWPELLAAKASVRFGDKKVTLVNVHLTWPWPQKQWRHIEQLGGNVFQPADHLVIAGYFNASPWSNAMQQIEQLSGARLTRSVCHTWLPRMAGWDVAPPAILTLDHTLVSDGLKVVARQKLGDIGSDHLPIMTEIAPIN